MQQTNFRLKRLRVVVVVELASTLTNSGLRRRREYTFFDKTTSQDESGSDHGRWPLVFLCATPPPNQASPHNSATDLVDSLLIVAVLVDSGSPLYVLTDPLVEEDGDGPVGEERRYFGISAMTRWPPILAVGRRIPTCISIKYWYLSRILIGISVGYQFLGGYWWLPIGN
ncbi:hypothetical protein L484_002844 [Morus notabilis]|uniref:Uncharacterized protein n=1 Tax=Morus notabilis TaxID=981085 RepID=W9SDY2_9ROSA|nr:hypothetical protein L484_002844 [Morus notabilis]